MNTIKGITYTTFIKLFSLALGLILTSFSSDLNAQNKKLQRAIELYNYSEYADAIPLFKKVIEEDKSLYTPVKYLANTYRKIKEYDKAELYYILAVNSDSSLAEDHLYYGQALKANGKLAAAKDQFVKFAELSNNDFLGNMMLQSIDELKSWDDEPKGYRSVPQNNLNSPLSEYGLVRFKDKLLFTSNRDVHENSPEASSFDDSPFFSIYEMDSSFFKNRGRVKVVMSTGLINTEYHDGPLTINEQEDKLIITRIDNQMRGKNFVNRMKLYQAEYIDGKWKNFSPLPFNSDDYSVCHAHLADSGKTLYFASDMPGGIGGFDLYVSKWENNTWSSPKNLGKAINTKQNEVYPYEKNNKLYFSSDGFPGYGGLDILVSEYKDSWQAPKNLKSPINSSRDDFSLYFISDSVGFYASNREGGKGEDDIYWFRQQVPQRVVTLNGLFEYKGLPLENIKLAIYDVKDSILDIEFTDSLGRFIIPNMLYNKEFYVKIESENADYIRNGRVFLTDSVGKKLRLLNRILSGYFAFRALPVEEFAKLDSLEANDPSLLSGFKFMGKVFKKLPGDQTEPVMVYLVDKEGMIVDSVLTDPNGGFNFEKLANSDDFIIRLKEYDPGMIVALENQFGRVFEVIEANSKGYYQMSTIYDPGLDLASAKNNGITSLTARLEYQGAPLPNEEVLVFDYKDSLIARTFTNTKGEFQTNILEFDDEYYIWFPRVEDQKISKSLLYAISQDGKALYNIDQMDDLRFHFFSLPYEEYQNVQKKLEKYVPHIIKIAGQIYKKLPGDQAGGMQVYVIDSEGMIVDSVMTDAQGKFNFEKLNSDQNYTFKLKDAEEDFNLAFLNDKDQIVELATINDKGNFAYKKLTYQIAQFEPLEEVDEGLVDVDETELFQRLRGQVFQKLPGDFKAGMKVFVYDKEGTLLGVTVTNALGEFTFEKLPKDVNYFYKIEDEDDHFQLVTLDENNRIIDKTIKNKFGQFKYSSLSLDRHELLLAEERDQFILDLNIEREDLSGVAIHYRFDSVEVRPIDRPILDSIIDNFAGSKQILEVHSYTDNRGSKEYNLRLSKLRTDKVIRYLVRHGFPREQIIGNYSGMLNPVVDCNTKDCDNDDHYLNRRTEFKLLNSIN